MLQDKSLLKIELATGTLEDAHKVVQAIEQARVHHKCPHIVPSQSVSLACHI